MSQEQKESWIDRALQIMLIGLIGWNLVTTQQLSVSVARLEVRVDTIDAFKQVK